MSHSLTCFFVVFFYQSQLFSLKCDKYMPVLKKAIQSTFVN
uniref:Uncharacterized protein n=1 Tax=Anguilla anguilla TaxID=7936 RepID=A0A0E9QRU4_ANGAN